jgi:hypothetical protein
MRHHEEDMAPRTTRFAPFGDSRRTERVSFQTRSSFGGVFTGSTACGLIGSDARLGWSPQTKRSNFR